MYSTCDWPAGSAAVERGMPLSQLVTVAFLVATPHASTIFISSAPSAPGPLHRSKTTNIRCSPLPPHALLPVLSRKRPGFRHATNDMITNRDVRFSIQLSVPPPLFRMRPLFCLLNVWPFNVLSVDCFFVCVLFSLPIRRVCLVPLCLADLDHTADVQLHSCEWTTGAVTGCKRKNNY